MSALYCIDWSLKVLIPIACLHDTIRYQIAGVDVGGRWEDVHEICRPYLDGHISAFSDIHILMSLCGLKKLDMAEAHMKGVREYIK